MQASAELFDEEGYLRTGDAMEQTAEGTLVWIDRVKNILKLSQVSTSTSLVSIRFSPHLVYCCGSSMLTVV